MRKLSCIAFVIIFLAQSAWANERTRMRAQDRLIFGLVADVWDGLPGQMETNLINRGVVIDFVPEYVLGTSNFSIASGLSFNSHNIYSDNYRYQSPTYDFTNHEFGPIPSNEWDVSINRLRVNYLSVPVELRFRSRDLPHTFRVHAGIKAGYNVFASTRFRGKIEGKDAALKEAKLDNINEYMLGAHFRIGYSRFNFYAFMPLTNVFIDNNAEDASFISLGLSAILF